jgi:hypothetical protein
VAFVFLAAILLLKAATRHQKLNISVLVSCAFVLGVGLLLAAWRHWLGNWTAPRFGRGDNPAAAAPHLLTRLLTFNHIYGLNLLLLLCPVWLSFDWALGCVPLVTRDVNRVSLKQTNFFSVRTETNRNSICFGSFPVCFAKPITILFGLFWCFGTISKQPK